MNKEQVLKKLDNTVIQATTLELDEKLRKKFDELGFMWCDGESYLDENNWGCYGSKTCYNLASESYASKDYYTSEELKIIQAEEFLSWLNEDILLETAKTLVKMTPDGGDCNSYCGVTRCSKCPAYSNHNEDKQYCSVSGRNKKEWFVNYINEKEGNMNKKTTKSEQIIAQIKELESKLRCKDCDDNLLCQFFSNEYSCFNLPYTPEQALLVSRFIADLEGEV